MPSKTRKRTDEVTSDMVTFKKPRLDSDSGNSCKNIAKIEPDITGVKRKRDPISDLDDYLDEGDTDPNDSNYEGDTDPNDSNYEGNDEGDEGDDDDEGDYEAEGEQEDMELLRIFDPIAFENYKSVREELNRTEPSLLKILREPLRLSDRSTLLQLFEIYSQIPPNTDEWLHYRKKVNTTFEDFKNGYKQHSKFTPEQHTVMKNEIQNFTGNDTSTRSSMGYEIINLVASQKNKKAIYEKYNQLLKLKTDDDEYSKLKKWITWAIKIPHDKIKVFPTRHSNLTTFLRSVSDKLDSELFGMKNVKEQILVFLNSKLLNPNMKRCNLGLVGVPGCGKTAIARLLATVMDYPFEQISFGGATTASFLKGHEYTYHGAEPGEITKCLTRMKHKNGILFLDEYEKISDNKSISAALLHLTDPGQNNEYRDLYLSEITQDLSNLWFIYSMNSLPKDSALKDRIFSIKLPGYSHSEKTSIVIKHLLPKALKNAKLPPNSIIMDERTISYLVTRTCEKSDKGVRTIEKAVGDIINKVNFLVNNQDKQGKLTGFDISFDTGVKLSYPVTLTPTLIDTLVISKDLVDISLHMMYI